MLKNYWIHTRPKTFLPSFVFVLTGYALNPQKGQSASVALEILALFIIYSVLLFGGTCAINTHFDNDKGPLNFLENPPEKPKYLAQFGFGLMLLGCLGAAVFGFWPLAMAVFATFLSLAYSARVPGVKWRGKEVGGIDLLIDALGCGLVGVIMGATISGAEPSGRTLLIALVFTLTVAGSYPATQIFQLKASDNYKSARNFSSLLGARRALHIGSLFMFMGLLMIFHSLSSDFSNQPMSLTRQTLYLLFSLTFLMGIYKSLRWAQSPFEKSALRFKAVIFTLLGARLFWIAAEWLRI